jgi:Prolyl oligopeptidase family
LIQAGEADARRLVISGDSAAGFTALCALASEDHFAAGASRFGITDLETFPQQAPKFQAHELDRLVGPFPKRRPPTGPAPRCMPWTGLPGRCC